MLVCLVALAAGCLEAPLPEACASGCELAARVDALPVPPAPVAAPAALAWEECRGVVALLEAPSAQVRPLVPSALELVGASAHTASLTLEMLRCGRVAEDARVARGVDVARLLARVRPASDALPDAAAAHFVLLLAVSDAGLRSTLEASYVQAQHGDLAAAGVAGPLGAAGSLWRFGADDVELEIQFASSGSAYQSHATRADYWHGGPEDLRRIEAVKFRTIDAVLEQAGLVRITGGPLELDATAWTGQSYLRNSEAWTLSPQTYGGTA